MTPYVYVIQRMVWDFGRIICAEWLTALAPLPGHALHTPCTAARAARRRHGAGSAKAGVRARDPWLPSGAIHAKNMFSFGECQVFVTYYSRTSRTAIVHYEYMALAKKTSVVREAMFVFLNHGVLCAPQRMQTHLEVM